MAHRRTTNNRSADVYQPLRRESRSDQTSRSDSLNRRRLRHRPSQLSVECQQLAVVRRYLPFMLVSGAALSYNVDVAYQPQYSVQFSSMTNSVGKLIRRLREDKGVTQRRLAELIDSNYTYLSKIENGRLNHTPNSKTLIAIADALKVDRDWLLTECGRPPEKLTQSIAGHAEFFRRLGQLRGKQLDSALQPFPLLGRVPAGPLAEAIEDSEEFELANLFSPGEHYLLRVRGDSMIEDGIVDGDIAIVRRDSECSDGNVVVALIDGEEATMKRYYLQKSRIKLQPANAAMEPMYFEPERVQLRGQVVGLIRTNI